VRGTAVGGKSEGWLRGAGAAVAAVVASVAALAATFAATFVAAVAGGADVAAAVAVSERHGCSFLQTPNGVSESLLGQSAHPIINKMNVTVLS
jgi:hypothetical protein